MEQARNEVFIEGILLESTIETGTQPTTQKEYVRGELKILVNQKIDNVIHESIIPVRLFSMKITNAGNVSKVYQSILDFGQKAKSAASHNGIANADAIRIKQGRLAENIMIPRGSQKEVSFPEIQTSFIDIIDKTKVAPLTKFTITAAINAIREEVKNGDPTGSLVVKVAVPQYGDKLDLFDLIVHKPAAINFIQTNWAKGQTVNIQGYVNFTTKIEEIEEEGGFGDPIIVPHSTTVRELVITSGSAEPFDEERAYKKEDLNNALNARLARIEAQKAKQAQVKIAPKLNPETDF